MERSKTKPFYRAIYDQLKRDIETHKYGPNEQIPTEVELAKIFNVSVITSKRALLELQRDGLIYRTRGKGSFAKPPNPPAGTPSESDGSLNAGNRRIEAAMVSIVLPSDGHGFAHYIRGAADLLNKSGFYLSVHTTEQSKNSDTEILKDLSSKGIRGIIYYPVFQFRSWDLLMSLRFNGCSIITIDQRIPGLPIPSVVSNNYDGGYVCVKRLTELGHRRIAYVSCTHVEIASSVRERFHGYCSALYEHGINIDPDITIFDYVMDTEGDRVGAPASYGEQLLLRLRSLGVTSIVTEHDFLASELLRHAVHLNIKVPEELSVVGFDDLDLASRLPTPLTTVRQNFYEIGRKAAELAVRFMTTNAGVDDETHVVPVRFVERMTTGPVKEMGGNA